MLGEINAASQRDAVRLIPVTPDLAEGTREPDHSRFPPDFVAAQEIDFERLAPGDGVNVTLWGQDSVGMFNSGPNGMTDLGELVIDQAGAIYVAYLGPVHAQGLTLLKLRDTIASRFSKLTASLAVSVRRTDRRGQTVTIQGDLSKPGVYPIGPDTQRLSGLLSQAGPNQSNPEQLDVTFRRAGKIASVRLSDIYHDAASDIALRPGDSIVVRNIAKFVVVLGAAGSQSTVKLAKRNYSVLNALADARGLNDSLANPRAVFLLRVPRLADDASRDSRPVIYQFDFTKPEQISLAGEFAVRDSDTLYISDAPFTQLQKVLSAFGATLGAVGTARDISQ
jgi:polysaccharide export outer membrane protein